MPRPPDAVRHIIAECIDHYCNTRLHSALGYVTLRDNQLYMSLP